MNRNNIALVGSIVISVLVMFDFSLICALVLWWGAPKGEAALIIVGGVVQLAGMVVGYWVGSSSGSMVKTMEWKSTETRGPTVQGHEP